jgi:protein gp37
MYRDKRKYGQDPEKCVRSKTKFNEPLKWSEPHTVFACSWSDWFIDAADQWRQDAWDIIRRTPQHTYLILTKRPDRIQWCLPDEWPLPNVWLGVSVESEQYMGRVRALTRQKAALLFVSYEPALAAADFSPSFGDGIGWVIIGGESGPERREMDMRWARHVIHQCRRADVPCFVKQDSALKPGTQGRFTDEEWATKQFPAA